MGMVIKFPDERIARGGSIDGQSEHASIIILPVIRIERGTDEPTDGREPEASGTSGRKRRPRGTRP